MINTEKVKIYQYFVGKEITDFKTSSTRYTVIEKEIDAVKVTTRDDYLYFIEDVNDLLYPINDSVFIENIKESDPYIPEYIYSLTPSKPKAVSIFITAYKACVKSTNEALSNETQVLKDLSKDA